MPFIFVGEIATWCSPGTDGGVCLAGIRPHHSPMQRRLKLECGHRLELMIRSFEAAFQCASALCLHG